MIANYLKLKNLDYKNDEPVYLSDFPPPIRLVWSVHYKYKAQSKPPLSNNTYLTTQCFLGHKSYRPMLVTSATSFADFGLFESIISLPITLGGKQKRQVCFGEISTATC